MRRGLAVLLLCGLMIGGTANILVAGTETQGKVTLAEAEKRLLYSGYSEGIFEMRWAKSKGDAIVPIMEQMLKKRAVYAKKENIGPFPYNVLWVLAHVVSPRALPVLERYYASTHEEYAKYAVQGRKLRMEKKSQAFGIVVTEGKLLRSTSKDSLVVSTVPPGTAIQVLKENVPNKKEEGPRGGYAIFDQVKILSSGSIGYIQRMGVAEYPFF